MEVSIGLDSTNILDREGGALTPLMRHDPGTGRHHQVRLTRDFENSSDLVLCCTNAGRLAVRFPSDER